MIGVVIDIIGYIIIKKVEWVIIYGNVKYWYIVGIYYIMSKIDGLLMCY